MPNSRKETALAIADANTLNNIEACTGLWNGHLGHSGRDTILPILGQFDNGQEEGADIQRFWDLPGYIEPVARPLIQPIEPFRDRIEKRPGTPAGLS